MCHRRVFAGDCIADDDCAFVGKLQCFHTRQRIAAVWTIDRDRATTEGQRVRYGVAPVDDLVNPTATIVAIGSSQTYQRVVAGATSQRVCLAIARQHVVACVTSHVQRTRTGHRDSPVGDALREDYPAKSSHPTCHIDGQVVHICGCRACRIAPRLDPHRVAGIRCTHRRLHVGLCGWCQVTVWRHVDVATADDHVAVQARIRAVDDFVGDCKAIVDGHTRPTCDTAVLRICAGHRCCPCRIDHVPG